MKVNTIILAIAMVSLMACSKKKTDPVPTVKASSLSADAGFGTNGSVFLPGIVSGKIDLLDDNRIMLTTSFANFNSCLIRFYPTGATDHSFGNWGKLEYVNSSMDEHKFYIQPNGKIWKFHGDCERLGVNGQSELVLSGSDAFGPCAQLPDNSLLISQYNNFKKLHENGSPDNSFSSDGISEDIPDGIRACLYYKDNVYIWVGSAHGIAIRKMSALGEYISDFGNNGLVYNHEINSINFDYKIFNDFLYVYYSYSDDNMNAHGTLIRRYDLNGILDVNFGSGGEIRIPPIQQGHSDFVKSLEVSENGDIYIFGSQNFTNTFLYKLKKDGQKELPFGINGMLTIDDMAVAQDMKIRGKDVYILGTEKDKNSVYGYSSGSSLLVKYTIE